MANPASALGEAIGHLIESEVQNIVKEATKDLDCYVDVGGKRSTRKGVKTLLVNDTGNQYQIDTIVEDSEGNPIVLIECKYIRYKKHNRDKASWTCVAHYKLRTTYPSVKKSIAVLVGDWTAPSKKLMESFGVEIIEIPFSKLVEILSHYSVVFNWAEKDSETPKKSLEIFQSLSNEDKSNIAKECLSEISEELSEKVKDAINSSEVSVRSVSQIELLLKTDRKEYVLKKFNAAPEAIMYLASLTGHKDDLGHIIK